MPLTLNNMLCTPVSDRGGASHLSLNLTTLTMITNVPTPPPLPVPHFLFHSQRYVVFHFKVLRDYSNIHYINNKWNAIELEKSWTPTLAYIPKQTDLDMQKLLLWQASICFSPFLKTVVSFSYWDFPVPVWRFGEVHSLPSLLFTVDVLNVEFPCLWNTTNKGREGRARE